MIQCITTSLDNRQHVVSSLAILFSSQLSIHMTNHNNYVFVILLSKTNPKSCSTSSLCYYTVTILHTESTSKQSTNMTKANRKLSSVQLKIFIYIDTFLQINFSIIQFFEFIFTACILIHTHCMEGLKYPYFH